MGELFHIYIQPRQGVTREQVEASLNGGLDWFRYRDGAYVVVTTSDQHTWQNRLQPHVEPDGFLFICKLDATNHQGWMDKKFWEWLHKYAPYKQKY
jgi:hypothetical protein